MAEKDRIVKDKSITYEGLFDMKEFYFELEKKLSSLGYEKVESSNLEQVEETGKDFEIKIFPEKAINDSMKLVLFLIIRGFNITEVEIEQEGVRTVLNKGKVRIDLEGYLITDLENHWTNSPFYYFLKVVMDRFVYPNQFSKYSKLIISDSEKLLKELKSFLNMGKYD